MSIQEGVLVDATWQGKSTPHMNIEDMHEILWELSELGFRLEILSVDSHLRVIENDSALRRHQKHLEYCFLRGPYDWCWIVELVEAHHSLTESSWMRQAPFYVAFGWAPTLPFELGHIPDVDAEYSEHAASLTKSAGYYHDVTDWEASY
ncbi:hypothetical protein IW261DRAFT_1594642 [Armillaria novae-zelandiae]|uniref:Uncharacterized protein n=1 Tax=Armillaria novae-zelandiae TaxID=153914 RepID=A0AA39U8J4_9AGAR|nr:hypothetical protein IW261DRAFT_1594642 [Armillaria novae-zelandiae]